ncbi:MAG: type IV-A pilus assembly ATPase PilB [Candidatus Eisenbacteria bacterium]|nr:type IV-A pilus assembly ATPase PilB [Candidatus Eisenbacteria bacterium]
MYDGIATRLVEERLVSQEALDKALKQKTDAGSSVTGNLVKMGAITEEDLTKFLSELYNTPVVHLSQLEIDRSVIKLIPGDVASKFQALPVGREGRKLKVAMVNPSNIFAIDDIKFLTGLEVQPLIASESDIKKAIDRYYDSAESLASVMRSMEEEVEIVEEQPEEETGVLDEVDQAPVVKLVNSLIADAVRKNASDIHVEPYEKTLRIRFRMDGVLYEMMAPPFKMKAAMISRLKIMAELDIAERRVPQDGRIKLRAMGKMIDLRVSTLPTIFGEKVVMRILDKSNLDIDLTKAGFQQQALDNLLHAIQSPYGIVLVTGPTGSGKTTTLYSALSKISTPEVNIMTAEDPVEYNIEGINQVQVHEEIGLTFAAALKAFLRQDPNIIMVGEIRDLETGSIATKAALTGHLVLSTLHTNDAPSSVNRLIDMGIEPFLVASSTNVIVAQRLIRRICPHCKHEVKLHPEVVRELGLDPEEAKHLVAYEGKGCVDCNNTGYKGRQGVFEVMPISPSIRDMILDRASTSDLRKKAREEGMVTLREDAIFKLKNGLTTAEEVLRETAPDER